GLNSPFADIDNIVGLKEASGDIAQIAKTASLCRGRLDLYSGNDDQIVPLLALGGVGVISVLANVAPKYTHDMVYSFLEGDATKATKMQLDCIPLVNALFKEVNPMPIKEALNLIGFDMGDPRLPLCNVEKSTLSLLKKELVAFGFDLMLDIAD
ncbi:unnamed protein product, partial [marine sediment metagenome]